MADVFISYSRREIAFARLINQSLIDCGIETWIDWDRIPISTNWWEVICQAILDANVFMFIISENSLKSEWCQKEIQQALEHHKRIVPVIVDETPDAVVSQYVPAIAWVQRLDCKSGQAYLLESIPVDHDCPDEERYAAYPKMPQFREASEKLSEAIKVDYAWLNSHTELEKAAKQWNDQGKDVSHLLHGTRLQQAEVWLEQASDKGAQPTLLQTQFISASRQDETRQQELKLSMEKKLSQRLLLVMGAIAIGLVLALFLGANWYNQRNQYLAEANSRATAESNALNEADRRATAQAQAQNEAYSRATAQAQAEIASTQAVEQRNEARRQAALAVSGKLMTDSSVQLDTHIDLGLLLAMESYRTAQSSQSRSSLLTALLAEPRLLRVFPQDQNTITSIAFSSDGKLLAVGGCGKWQDAITCEQSLIQLWDTGTGKLIGSLPGDENTSQVAGLAFRPDGKTLLAASRNGNLVEWDVASQKSLGAYRRLGYRVRHARSNQTTLQFSQPEIEELARLEHLRYMKSCLLDGWRWGSESDSELKTKRALLLWDPMEDEALAAAFAPEFTLNEIKQMLGDGRIGPGLLFDADKKVNVELIREIPVILERAGCTIEKLG